MFENAFNIFTFIGWKKSDNDNQCLDKTGKICSFLRLGRLKKHTLRRKTAELGDRGSLPMFWLR